MSLLAIKLADPSAIHILRGNHETPDMYQNYGFQTEIKQKYDSDVMNKFTELFEGISFCIDLILLSLDHTVCDSLLALPVAAVLQDKVFVVHGGIGPKAMECTIKELSTHIIKREQSKISFQVFEELLWSGKRTLTTESNP